MTLMLLLFAVSLVVLARSLNRSFIEAHRLEFANAALARRLQVVHQSGGVVELMSEPGRGTVVELHLPRRDERVDDTASAEPARDSA